MPSKLISLELKEELKMKKVTKAIFLRMKAVVDALLNSLRMALLWIATQLFLNNGVI